MCASGSDDPSTGTATGSDQGDGTFGDWGDPGATGGNGGDGTVGDWTDGDPGTGNPGDTSVPCDHKAISGFFVETQLRCGEVGFLNGNGVNISEGAQTSFWIYRMRDGVSQPESLTPMYGQFAASAWMPQKPTDHMPGDVYDFVVTADGVDNTSSNKFQFREFGKHGPSFQSWRLESGDFGWDAGFDAIFADDQLTINVRIRLLNHMGPKADDPDDDPPIGPPVSDEDKFIMQQTIQNYLSSRLWLRRRSCRRGTACTCWYPVVVQVWFVEDSSEHHQVHYYPGTFRADSAHWPSAPDHEWIHAHETGHLLGWYDEYAGGAVGPPPRWWPVSNFLMGWGNALRADYGLDFSNWLAGQTGEQWEVQVGG